MAKSVYLQTEYIDTRKTRIIIHGVSMDISEDRMGVFFVRYGQVEDVSAIINNRGIASILQVTITARASQK